MAQIGRLDVAHGLQQFFEIQGGIEPDLGEGIVPVAVLADLQRSPFGVALPFVMNTGLNGIAAQYSYAVLVPDLLNNRSWINVEQIILGFAANSAVYILPYLLSAVPAGLSPIGPLVSAKQADSTRRKLPEGRVDAGGSVTAPTGEGTVVRGLASTCVVVPGNWSINSFGALVVASTATLQGIEVSFFGSLHLTGTK